MQVKPKHTAQSVAKRLAEGLQDGTILLETTPMETFTPDEIHNIYIRMSEINETLLSNPAFPIRPEAGELLGLCCELGQAAVRLKVFTEKLRTTDPQLHRIWVDVLEK